MFPDVAGLTIIFCMSRSYSARFVSNLLCFHSACLIGIIFPIFGLFSYWFQLNS